MPVVLITGAATGIGNLTARALADAGHVVYASMRDMGSANAERAERLVAEGRERGFDPRVVELDVTSRDSAHAAVDAVLAGAGRLDVACTTPATCRWATSRRSPSTRWLSG
jgi:NAD(P)-dependent dehydrogenase (short-subunit alcohol dehydrogenase family)